MKQSKLRRRRVIRYAILYFVLLVLFLALIIAPAILGSKLLPLIPKSLTGKIAGQFQLMQPAGFNNDNTNSTMQTGTGNPSYTGYLYQLTKTDSSHASATDGGGKIKLF